MTERRVCPCRATVESEPDEQSVAHALRAHFAQSEHQLYIEAEEASPSVATVLRALADNERRLTVVGRC